MKKLITFFTIYLFFSAIIFAQEIQQQNLDRNGYPTFVKFDTKLKSVSKDETKTVLARLVNMNENGEYKPLRTENDKLGYVHERFQQYYNGIKVENGVYIAHSKNNVLESISGEFKSINKISNSPSISSESAISKARAFVNAQEYMKDSDIAISAPELVIVAHDYGKHPKDVYEMVLAYKVDVYATKPLSRDYVYVDANTGEIVHTNAIIKTATALGSADTRYSGTKTISTDSYNGSYRLRDVSRGGGINTYDCNTSTSYTSAVDFTDNDNNWTALEWDNAQKDNGALDAHWAGMMTYDYWKDVHGRNSFDGNGALIKTYVHFDLNYENAYWNGSVMTFGDGASTFDILTSLDVFGHEFGHAVCSYTADLIYSKESGALNEAFSDIWGCTIENHYAPEKSNWLMGEDIGYVLRSLSDPKSKGLPDTYLGVNWVTSSADYYGVHTNNGPFCYWYYLISEGGTGTNDNNNAYNVAAIGISKAEKIAYRMESVYMTASSNYANARTFAIQSAIDLYGAGSPEEISVTNAMYAIGVGDAYGGVTPTPQATYCVSKGTNFSYEWIGSVKLGTYTKTSAGSSYSDYTATAIPVTGGQSYAVTLTPTFASTTYNEYWKIWIDYNNDTIFDANELVYDAGALSKVAVSGNISIPTGISGLRRMRVSMKYNAAQTACETFAYGEVEDYAVNISQTTSDTQAPTAPTNLAATNVTQTTLTLGWTASTDNVAVTAYDVYKNGALLASTATTSYNVSGLTAATAYSFYVKAKDAAGNVSAASTTINVTTAAPDIQAPSTPANLAASSVAQSTLTLGWTASTDNIAVTGYDVYKNGALLASTSATSYNVSGLTAATAYSFYVKAKDAAGNVSAASNTINVTTAASVVSYCTSKGSNATYEWIDLVQLNEINNVTASNSGYANFSNLTASVARGSSQTIYISCGFKSTTYTEFWAIWIDWNQNGIFDTNEKMVSGSSTSSGTLSGTFTVPADAVLGTTRMRVSMKYNSAQTACETFSYGEVEDYSVNVMVAAINSFAAGNPTAEELGNALPTEIVIYPNPASASINVNISDGSALGTLKIYTMAGTLVKIVEMDGGERDINISDLAPGSYLISVETEREPIVKSFIKR